MKILRNNIKLIVGFIIGVVVCSSIGVMAYSLNARDISFKSTNPNWNVSNLEDAMNDLYKDSNGSNPDNLIGFFWPYDYSGEEETFTAAVDGTYKLEVWGAQGGTMYWMNNGSNLEGGYGGYSVGSIKLKKNEKLYINVGERGNSNYSGTYFMTGGNGGYNGGGKGGNGVSNWPGGSGGGGATHIATKSGLLSTLEDDNASILIVAGGGGGSLGGSAGGYIGNAGEKWGKVGALGGTQSTGYAFGLGQSGASKPSCVSYGCEGNPGAGGGYYGGYAGSYSGAYSDIYPGGGSGYIGNTLLTDKTMYCYNCAESSADDTKTISTTNVSMAPTSNYAKKGNGYVKITYLGK